LLVLQFALHTIHRTARVHEAPRNARVVPQGIIPRDSRLELPHLQPLQSTDAYTARCCRPPRPSDYCRPRCCCCHHAAARPPSSLNILSTGVYSAQTCPLRSIEQPPCERRLQTRLQPRVRRGTTAAPTTAAPLTFLRCQVTRCPHLQSSAAFSR